MLGADVATGGRVGEQRLLRGTVKQIAHRQRHVISLGQRRRAHGRWSRASAPGRTPSPDARRWSVSCRCTRSRGHGRPSSWRRSDRAVARCTRRSSDTVTFLPEARTTSRTSLVVTLMAFAAASRVLIFCTSSRPRASRSASVVGSREPHAKRLMAASPARADRQSMAFHVRAVMSSAPLDGCVAAGCGLRLLTTGVAGQEPGHPSTSRQARPCPGNCGLPTLAAIALTKDGEAGTVFREELPAPMNASEPGTERQ